jgi:hypothetical protein
MMNVGTPSSSVVVSVASDGGFYPIAAVTARSDLLQAGLVREDEPCMGSRSARRVALIAGVMALAAPAAAHAAVKIAVPKGCVYASSADTAQTVPYNLAGMAAGAHYTVKLDGTAVATGVADATGLGSGEFPAPVLRHTDRQSTVSVTDGVSTDQQTIDLTDFDATITPSTGTVRRRVKISLFGWVGKTVFLHYIAPHATKPSRTVRVTRTGGRCGRGTARLAHLFPAGAKRGAWRLIFDTSRRYHSTAKLRIEYDTTIH